MLKTLKTPTVREFINALSEFPQDSLIAIEDTDTGWILNKVITLNLNLPFVEEEGKDKVLISTSYYEVD